DHHSGMHCGAEIGHELTDKGVQLIHVKSGNLCCTHETCFLSTIFPALAVLSGKRLARNVWVPVHERAVGIVLPGPDMQGIEGREPEAIGAFPVMKELSHEFWRTFMLRIPRIGHKQKIGAD